jgi:predicted GNAT family acetyltransferase
VNQLPIAIVHHAELSRFAATAGERLVGVVHYVRGPGSVDIVHTEVDEQFEGRGIGGELAKAALDAARAEGLTVKASCPFVAEYIRDNPQYADLLDSTDRS